METSHVLGRRSRANPKVMDWMTSPRLLAAALTSYITGHPRYVANNYPPAPWRAWLAKAGRDEQK